MTKRTYTVQTGDSLWSITERFGLDPDFHWIDLYRTNARLVGSNPDLIHLGQVLQVPRNWPDHSTATLVTTVDLRPFFETSHGSAFL